jgi:hypothetical protein
VARQRDDRATGAVHVLCLYLAFGRLATLLGMGESRSAAIGALAAFRAALEVGDPAAASATFADGAVLRSTATDRIRFTGDELRALLAAVSDAYEDVRIVHESAAGGSFTLILAARIGRQRFQETIVARVDRAGLIERVHASVRPLGGLLAVTSAIGVRLARRRGRIAAWSFRVLMAPLQAMAAVGDVIGARLATSPGSRV